MLHRLVGGEARVLLLLFPQLHDLQLDQVEDLGGSIRIVAHARTEDSECHGCGTPSRRVHGRYERRLHDLACGGRPVLVDLEVRRFVCMVAVCPVTTFVEQLPGLTQQHQRRTVGLRARLERVALALAGRAGARLAWVLGMVVSRSTLIRMVRALPDPPVGQVMVLGVDDFAKKKGNSYGTVLLDLDTHRTVDLLPDREADTFADWLKAHPGVQVICRDRAGAYASGGREGAPEATQVADRFHLWQNLGEAVEKTVIAHRGDLREPEPDVETESEAEVEVAMTGTTPPTEPPVPSAVPDGFRDVLGRQRRLVVRHQERYAAVQALRAEGHNLTEIGRRLGIGQDTVRRFARATSLEEVLVKAISRPSILDPFKPYLNQQRNAGITNATTLQTELQAQGWTGDIQAVRRYLRQFRGGDGRTRAVRASLCPAAAPAAPAPPKPRKVVRWIMTRPDRLSDQETAKLTALLERSPGLHTLADHVRGFAEMMTELQGHRLDEWITAVRSDDLPALHSFANGLERDQAAVLAGLTLPYSSGAVEGRICKIIMWNLICQAMQVKRPLGCWIIGWPVRSAGFRLLAEGGLPSVARVRCR